MEREGGHHGIVRSYRILPPAFNPRPKTRVFSQFDFPPTTGFFTSKPTNHSQVRLHPAGKSKVKTKGTQKLKYWLAVVEGRPTLRFPGFSASGLLDHLSYSCYMEDEVEDEGEQVDYHSFE